MREIFFLQKLKIQLFQVFRYVFVGGIAFLVDWGGLYIFTSFGLHYLASSTIAFTIGLIANFVLAKSLFLLQNR